MPLCGREDNGESSHVLPPGRRRRPGCEAGQGGGRGRPSPPHTPHSGKSAPRPSDSGSANGRRKPVFGAQQPLPKCPQRGKVRKLAPRQPSKVCLHCCGLCRLPDSLCTRHPTALLATNSLGFRWLRRQCGPFLEESARSPGTLTETPRKAPLSLPAAPSAPWGP